MQSLWMLLACAMFAIMGASIKTAAEFDANLAQIVLFRGLPSIVFIFVWTRVRRHSLRPPSWKAHILRNLFGVSSMWMGFFSLTILSLSTSVSLTYTAPLFIGIWMLFFGGTQRDPARILAVLLGFIGVVAILRPSIGDDEWFAALVALCAGAFAAAAMLQVRELGRMGEPEWRTVFLFSCFVCLSSVVGLVALGWVDLGWQGWAALIGVGSSGFVGQLAMTRAFGKGSALLTASLQYTTIIFAALLGIVFWADIPDPLAWAGMALIIGSGMLSLWRTHSEDRLMRRKASSAEQAETS